MSQHANVNHFALNIYFENTTMHVCFFSLFFKFNLQPHAHLHKTQFKNQKQKKQKKQIQQCEKFTCELHNLNNYKPKFKNGIFSTPKYYYPPKETKYSQKSLYF